MGGEAGGTPALDDAPESSEHAPSIGAMYLSDKSFRTGHRLTSQRAFPLGELRDGRPMTRFQILPGAVSTCGPDRSAF